MQIVSNLCDQRLVIMEHVNKIAHLHEAHTGGNVRPGGFVSLVGAVFCASLVSFTTACGNEKNIG